MSSIEATYRARFPKSAEWVERGRRVFPNAVTHDSRHLQPYPVYIESAQGSRKTTAEGHSLIDYWMGHGALLLGHSHPAVVEAVTQQMARGTHYGANHRLEIEWAEQVQRLMPAAQKLRFTNSGTEATLMALRISRIVTGRTKVLKFAGHFHGWHDLLIPGADGPYDTGAFGMPGITSGVLQDLIIIPPNNLEILEQTLREQKPACVILEATGGHWGMVPMRGDFLRAVRRLTEETGTLLIFDEVITGFRVSSGGSQVHYNIQPDMTSLAKILAGGLPGGALAGRADVMDALEFENRHGQKMRHPGTYNGNPLSAAAGIAALNVIEQTPVCEQANAMGRELRAGLNELFSRRDIPWVAYGEFSMVTIHPDYHGPRPTDDQFIPYDNNYLLLDKKWPTALSHAFRCAALLNGVDFFGWRAMLSAAHAPDDIQQTIEAVDAAITLLQQDGLVS